MVSIACFGLGFAQRTVDRFALALLAGRVSTSSANRRSSAPGGRPSPDRGATAETEGPRSGKRRSSNPGAHPTPTKAGAV
jgi:hypothetical protein